MIKLNKILIFSLFVFLLFISCSGYIRITFSGRIFGYNPSDSSSYQIDFMNSGRTTHFIIDSTLKIDSNGIYKITARFLNVGPECINLLKNGKVVDRYCVNRSNYKEFKLFNVFTGEQFSIENINNWKDHIVNNIDFNPNNFLKNSNILKFDSVWVDVVYNSKNSQFDFQIHDSSGSFEYGDIHYYGQFASTTHFRVDSLKFSLPAADFPKNKSSWDNTLFLDIYSKFGWYKTIYIELWKQSKY